MEKDIEIISKRWYSIESEVLSVVRKQLSTGTFSVNAAQNRLRTACNEWFEGSLSPSIWYDEFSLKEAAKAKAFKEYVYKIELKEFEIPKPSRLWAIVLTIISVPVAYLLLYLLKESSIGWLIFPHYVRIILSIATGVLTWTISELTLNKQRSEYEESIVAGFKEQLDNHCAKLKQILS